MVRLSEADPNVDPNAVNGEEDTVQTKDLLSNLKQAYSVAQQAKSPNKGISKQAE